MTTGAQERRKAERVVLSPPGDATLDGQSVRLLDVGALGAGIVHDAFVEVGAQKTLSLSWNGERIVLDSTVVRCDRDSSGFHIGLVYARPEADNARIHRLLDSLEQREEIERLKKLVEASKLINSSIDAQELFASILQVARQELHVERGTLYFVDEKTNEIWAKIAGDLEGRQIRLPIGKGIAGNVAASGEAVLLHDAYSDDRFDQTLDRQSGYRTRSMLCAPIKNREGKIVGVLQLLNKTHGSFGPRDLAFLDSISDHMAIAMENATLHLELLEKQRMERELQLGREIQSSLLGTAPSDIVSVELSAMSLPCYEVGGDYYDFLELPGGDLGLAIGDVSGKGVGAALIMSSVQAALRVAAPIESDLAWLATRLNSLIYRAARGRKYVTFFFGRYSPSTGKLEFVNAGHCPPFVVHDGVITRLTSTGRPIGIFAEARYETGIAQLEPGDAFVLYTDGLNEAENPAEEEFGMQRLEEVVCSAATGAASAMPGAILDAVTRYEQGAHATDDKTIVVMRRC